VKVIDSFGVVEVCIHARIVPVVEKQEAAVMGDKRLHGIARIIGDGHPLRVLEGGVWQLEQSDRDP
jgi:hypothetical protein